jgi:hypothetical protein
MVEQHGSHAEERVLELQELNKLPPSVSDDSAQRQSLEAAEERFEPGVRLPCNCRVDT